MEQRCSTSDSDATYDVTRHFCDTADESDAWDRHLVEREAECAASADSCSEYLSCKMAIAPE
jgi:hypothetical protein